MIDLRRVMFPLIALSLGVGVALAFAEGVVRLTLDLYECDSELGWRFTAHKVGIKIGRKREFFQLVRFNALGFRDHERGIEKPPDNYRIVILGDSFPAALQVAMDEAFPQILERQLAAEVSPGQIIEVINMATDGYGTAQELLAFRQLSKQLRPDLVLLFVFPYNDLGDNSVEAGTHYLSVRCGRPHFGMQNGVLSRLELEHPLARSPLLERWLRKSRIYSNFVSKPPYLFPGFMNGDTLYRDPPEGVEDAYELTSKLIALLAQEVADAGSAFAAVLVPDKHQILRRFRNVEMLDVERPEKRLGGVMRAQAIHYLDLQPVLRSEAANGAQLYFELDAHFNPEGHQLVAKYLHEWLTRECGVLGLPLAACNETATP